MKVALALAATAPLAFAKPRTDTIVLDKLPDSGKEWSTLKNGMEYQPAANLSPVAEYHLRRLTSEDVNAYDTIYANGAETVYDDYAQAWRALGFYIDCDQCDEAQADGGGEEDAGAGCVTSCQRFMLWAAYVDEGYEGNQVNEYKYYDRKGNRWSDTACKDSSRCVPLDCHDPDTHFSLLGFFKEPQYDLWFDQLFQTQADCLWTDSEYQFMNSGRLDYLPTGCTETTYRDDDDVLYLDTRPSLYGEMEIGLYTDAQCSEEYSGSASVQQVVQGMVCQGYLEGGNAATDMCPEEGEESSWSLYDDMDKWNDAFDVFKQCQPCKVSSLTHLVAGRGYSANADGFRYTHNENDEAFQCDGDAAYYNYNQCELFTSNTGTQTATWRDVELAGTQGTITGISIPGHAFSTYGKGLSQRASDNGRLLFSWVVLLVSSVLFGFTIFRYKSMADDANEMEANLVTSPNGVSA